MGSDFSNDLILVSSDVDPRHLRVVDEGGEVFLEDLSGREEARLNGETFSRALLHPGDELYLGPYVFHISMELDAAPYGEERSRHGDGKRLLTRFRAIRQPPVLALLTLCGIIVLYLWISSLTPRDRGGGSVGARACSASGRREIRVQSEGQELRGQGGFHL